MNHIVFLLFFTAILSASVITPIPTEVKYDKATVALGKKLFFDPILSKDKTISCANCHGIFGGDSRVFSVGIAKRMGNVNSPTIFNSTFNIALFWNGRAESFEEQANEVLHDFDEMESSAELIDKRLKNSTEYQKLFQEAFKKSPSYELTLKAIADFQRTLITPNSKFDRYLRKEEKLTTLEQRGFEKFKSLGCVSCHNGINVGGNSYQKFGNVIPFPSTNENVKDRFHVTGHQSDKDVFRVPSLRNISKTPPYFHNGSVQTLRDAVFLMGYHNLGIVIEKEDIDSIVLFLESLEGELPKTWIE